MPIFTSRKSTDATQKSFKDSRDEFFRIQLEIISYATINTLNILIGLSIYWLRYTLQLTSFILMLNYAGWKAKNYFTFEHLKYLKIRDEKELKHIKKELIEKVLLPFSLASLMTFSFLIYRQFNKIEEKIQNPKQSFLFIRLVALCFAQFIPLILFRVPDLKKWVEGNAAAWLYWPLKVWQRHQFHQQFNHAFLGTTEKTDFWKAGHDDTALKSPTLTIGRDTLHKKFGTLTPLVIEKMADVFNQFGIKNKFDTKSRVFTVWPEDLSKDDEKRFLDTLTKAIETCQRTSMISKEMKLFAESLEKLGLHCKIQSNPQKEIPFFTHTLIFRSVKIHALSPELLAIAGFSVTLRDEYICATVDFNAYTKYAKDELLTAVLLATRLKPSEETPTADAAGKQSDWTTHSEQKFFTRRVHHRKKPPALTSTDGEDSPRAREIPTRVVFSDDFKYPSSPGKPPVYPMRDAHNQFVVYYPKEPITSQAEERAHMTCVEAGHAVFDKYREVYKTHPRSTDSRLFATTVIRAKNDKGDERKALLHVFDSYDPFRADHAKM